MEKLTENDKELFRMFTNKHNYEKLLEKAIDEADDKIEKSSGDDTKSADEADKAIGFVKVLEEKLEKYQEIIENEYCDDLGGGKIIGDTYYGSANEERYFFLKKIFDLLKHEHQHGGFFGEDAESCKEMLSSIEDQEYLNKLRGHLKDIDNGKHPYDQEWYFICVWDR